jgi:hypothetical protein
MSQSEEGSLDHPQKLSGLFFAQKVQSKSFKLAHLNFLRRQLALFLDQTGRSSYQQRH